MGTLASECDQRNHCNVQIPPSSRVSFYTKSMHIVIGSVSEYVFNYLSNKPNFIIAHKRL